MSSKAALYRAYNPAHHPSNNNNRVWYQAHHLVSSNNREIRTIFRLVASDSRPLASSNTSRQRHYNNTLNSSNNKQTARPQVYLHI
jgi:hypothetical protein